MKQTFKSRFWAWLLAICMVVTLMPATAIAVGAANEISVSGNIDAYQTDSNGNGVPALPSGSYKLTGNVTSASFILLKEGNSYTIDLNGYSITCATTLYSVLNEGAAVTIKDSSTAKTGKIGGSSTSVAIMATDENASVVIEGGNFEGSMFAVAMGKGTGIINGGKFKGASTAASFNGDNAVVAGFSLGAGMQAQALIGGWWEVYDPSAPVIVYNAAELKQAIADQAKNIQLGADITLSETLTINQDVTINGSGFSLIRAASYTGKLLSISANVTMDNLTVDGNRDQATANHPSIYLNGAGKTLTLNNCTLKDSKNSYDYGSGGSVAQMGGAINIWDGTVVANNTTFTNNACLGSNGGGAVIYLSGGGETGCTPTATLKGCTVSENGKGNGSVATSSPILSANWGRNSGAFGVFNLENTAITGNASTSLFDGRMTMNLKGAVVIKENTDNLDTVNNTINNVGLTIGAEIVVEGSEGTAISGSGYAEGDKAYFKADDPTLEVIYDSGSLKLAKIVLDTVSTKEELELAIANGVSPITLSGNIAAPITIPAGKNIILDLNGYSISGAETAIFNNGTLTVTDSSTGKTGSIVGSKFGINNTGDLTVNAGTVEGTAQNGIFQSGAGKTVINGGTVIGGGCTVYNTGNSTGNEINGGTLIHTGSAGSVLGADRTNGTSSWTIKNDGSVAMKSTNDVFVLTGTNGTATGDNDVTVTNWSEIALEKQNDGSYKVVVKSEPVTSAEVATAEQFAAAMADADISEITLTADITLPAGLTVSKAVTVNGNGKTIKRGSGNNDTLFTVNQGGELILNDVTVDGGAAWSADGSTLMTAGGITPTVINSLQLGGIYTTAADRVGQLIVVNGGKVTLAQGTTLQNNDRRAVNSTIQNNGVMDQGSAVYVASGDLTMDATAVIKNNRVADPEKSQLNGDGAAISVENGGDILISGTITGNYSCRMGGAIRVFHSNSANVTVKDATVTDNYTGPGGHGAVMIGLPVTVSGKVIIDGNHTDGGEANLSANGTGALSEGTSELSAGSAIGVMVSETFVNGATVMTGAEESDLAYFTVDGDALNVIFDNGTVKLDLAQAKTAAKDAIDRAAADKKAEIDALTNLSDETKEELKQRIDDAASEAKSGIDGAATPAAIDTAKSSGIDAIAQITADAIAEDLAAGKTAAIDAINAAASDKKAAIDALPYLTAERKAELKAEVDAEAAEAIENINAAATAADVDTALSDGIAAINAVADKADAENAYLATFVHTITFDANGGVVSTLSAETGTDSKLTSLPTPTRAGWYTFDGWYTARSGGTKVTTATVFSDDTTVYARWNYIYNSVFPYVPTAGTTIPSVPNGTVTVSDPNAVTGQPVVITVTPNAGYELGSLTVTDSNGNSVPVTPLGNGRYSFNMPASRPVSVNAAFVNVKDDGEGNTGSASDPSNRFSDVDPSQWYYDSVCYAVENGLMQGLPGDLFDPMGTTSRAMIVTVLYRLEGEPTVSGSSIFADVPVGQWYTKAVAWANANGIVEGYGNGKFGPDDPITREQMVTILWRYAKYKGVDVSSGNAVSITGYTDSAAIRDYALPAMKWAIAEDIIGGYNGYLTPGDTATRGQVAAILHRYCLLIEE